MKKMSLFLTLIVASAVHAGPSTPVTPEKGSTVDKVKETIKKYQVPLAVGAAGAAVIAAFVLGRLSARQPNGQTRRPSLTPIRSEIVDMMQRYVPNPNETPSLHAKLDFGYRQDIANFAQEIQALGFDLNTAHTQAYEILSEVLGTPVTYDTPSETIHQAIVDSGISDQQSLLARQLLAFIQTQAGRHCYQAFRQGQEAVEALRISENTHTELAALLPQLFGQ